MNPVRRQRPENIRIEPLVRGLLGAVVGALGFIAASLGAAHADGDPDVWYKRLSDTLPGHWAPPDHLVWHSPTDLTNWKFGGFVGEFNGGKLLYFYTQPWRNAGKFRSEYLGAINATYNFVDLPYVPISLGMDFAAAHHFGNETFEEFDVAPTISWTWFPWNDFVYTQLRIGPLGASYDTSLSSLEAHDTKLGRTSRFLNYHVGELIFAPSKESKWEVYVGIHHRCGIYGLIDGIDGGSNYVTAGIRAGF